MPKNYSFLKIIIIMIINPIKEPQNLLKTCEKFSDRLTLIPWCNGRCATWDYDTVAASLKNTASHAGSAAENATSWKEEKYAEIVH